MHLNTLFVNLVACIASFKYCSAANGDLRLELVQVVFRHGARTPSQAEAKHVNVTDPAIYGPQGFYQLTNEGKEQAYKLGTLLRKKYDGYLGVYSPKEVYALTSGYVRTKLSLQATLAGLFPPSPGDTWNTELNWRPVPFTQAPTELDILLAPHQCPKYKEVYAKTIADSKYYQETVSNYTEFLEYMDEKTGFSFKTNLVYHIGWTYYAIKYHQATNLPLPNWCTDNVLKTIEDLFIFGLNGMSLTPKLKRLNGGTLVRKLIENINVNGKAAIPKKIYLYCTHDLTLTAISKVQNIQPFKIPPFGSAIIMELYRDSQKFEYIRMLAWNAAGDNFMTVRIANCEEFCPMKDYLKIVEDFIPSDEELDLLADDDLLQQPHTNVLLA